MAGCQINGRFTYRILQVGTSERWQLARLANISYLACLKFPHPQVHKLVKTFSQIVIEYLSHINPNKRKLKRTKEF
jgi:hypothetical protein